MSESFDYINKRVGRLSEKVFFLDQRQNGNLRRHNILPLTEPERLKTLADLRKELEEIKQLEGYKEWHEKMDGFELEI